MELSALTLGAAAGPASVATCDPDPAAARISSLVIVPSGPEPRIRLSSTPCSLARRRAFGEIFISWAGESSAAGTADADGRDSTVVVLALAVAFAGAAGGCSPGAT